MNPPPEVILEADSLSQLNTSDARFLLDTIDGLRALGVGDFVQLPQIIVVGDQSSGKSSVLEAISRVRFPVDGDLCTRFATELVLRRAPETAINVSIQFAEDVSTNAEDGTSGTPRPAPAPFHRDSFDRDALPGIIREAKERMGITNNGIKRFTKDVLRVEVTSPDVYPLTLVDLPGIFHSSTAEQNEADRNIVNALIESYMKQAKSIILLVVAANQQLATQAVLSTARKHDPDRKRTIGVITKPDMAGSANERKYLDLAKGRESVHRLALGWYVLRNRSEDERSSEAEVRDAVEERFFRTGEWSSVSPDNRGVESLRKRLSKVLLHHIKNNLDDLIDDIETRLRDRQQDLTRAGKPRSTPEELRSYLLGIAEEFQRLARDAVEGRYSDSFFGGFDQHDTRVLKLRALLRNMHDAFGLVMERKGASYKIEWEDANANEIADQANSGEIAEYLQPLYDLYNVPDPEPKPEAELNVLVQSLAFSNRGREFPGDTNPELVFLLFKTQSAPWETIAQQHLDYVVSATKEFVHRVFRHVTGADDATLNAILHDCVDTFFTDKEDILRDKLREIITPYKDGHGPPLDWAFRAKMQDLTTRRFANQFATRLERQHPELFELRFSSGAALNRQMILNAALEGPSTSDGSMFDTEKVIVRMLVYYEMSLRTFVNNIISLVIESCLIRDLPGTFTPTKVDGMDSERLQYLASETEDLQGQRQDLQQEVIILREGLRKCQRHRLRRRAVLPAALLRPSASGVPREASRDVTPEPSVTPVGDRTPPAAPPLAASLEAVPNNNTSVAGTTSNTASSFPGPGLIGAQFTGTTEAENAPRSQFNNLFTGPSKSTFDEPLSRERGLGSGKTAGTGGAFGQPSSGTGLGFGSKTSTGGAFGQPPSGTGFGFGFGSTTSTGGAFGQPPSGTGFGFGSKTSTGGPFGATVPSSTGSAPNSNTGNTTATNNTNPATNAGANADSTHSPEAPTSSTFPFRPFPPKSSSSTCSIKDLAYPGIDRVPLLQIDAWLGGVVNENLESDLQIPREKGSVLQHICFQPRLKRFSVEEMRLRRIVAGV